MGRKIAYVLLGLFFGVLSLPIPLVSANSDVDAIRRLLMSTFDKPEARLSVEPVVVAGKHAIAGWSQGDLGGRALLRSDGRAWSLILCSGDSLRSAEALRETGMSESDAVELARKLTEAEQKVAPERIALFGRFLGTVRMDATGHHPMATPTQSKAVPTYKVGDLVIEAPWLRATPGGAKVAGGYMRIINTGQSADRLVDGTLERAGRFEVHETAMVDNVARMRKLAQGLEIKPGQTVELKPGSYHVMGLELTAGYKEGETITGTLVFERAGTVSVEFRVVPIGATRGKHSHH
jgi:copper(I)-binding protein